MPRLSSIAAVAALVAGIAASPSASATTQRTFVASHGLDTNPCSIGAPCRSFATAALQTSANGEIIVLDSAGYGPVTITQSLSIIAPAGVYAGVSVLSGNGIGITGSTIRVVLRGLTINGQGGDFGIAIGDAAYVHIENVVVSGMAVSGICVCGAGRVFINDTVLRNNASSGLEIYPFAGLAQVSVDRLRSEANQNDGIYVRTDAILNIRDSVITRNFDNGINILPDSPQSVSVGIENTTITNNIGAGVMVQGTGSGAVVLAGNTIKDNNGGVTSGAPSITVYTRQTSTISQNNGSDVAGPVTNISGL